MTFRRTNNRYLLFTFLGIVIAAGCKKDDEDPVAPIITFDSITATTVEQFNNSIQIGILYEDYQGDLGREDPDDYSLRVRDARLGDYDWYHIPPMTPDNNELHIKGKYILELDPLFLMGTGTQESTTLTIQLQDKAGNWSNSIVTPVVLVVDSI
ncbi:MAG: hypothetical protein ACKVOK_02585 [Flavobacteriales bacterium]